MTHRTHTPTTRAAAIADYRNSGDSYGTVAARHGVSRATLHAWLNPDVRKPRGGWQWAEEDVALTGGRWVLVRGVRRWVEDAPPPAPTELIACPCGARLSEPCRTASGNWTLHEGRLLSRRCPCGNVPREGSRFCTDECRNEARAETYRSREKRTPTRERRAA